MPQVKAVLDGALKNKLIAAGYIQRSANAIGVGNKAGLFGYHTYTDSSLTHTMRNAEGTSSGWATQSSVALKDLDGEEQAKVAIDKCLRGINKKKLDAGKFTVILEPAAVADLIGWLGFAFGARDAEQGQSFLSKPAKIRPATARIWERSCFPRLLRCAAIRFIRSWHRRRGDRRFCRMKRPLGLKKAWCATFTTTDSGLGKLGRNRLPLR